VTNTQNAPHCVSVVEYSTCAIPEDVYHTSVMQGLYRSWKSLESHGI